MSEYSFLNQDYLDDLNINPTWDKLWVAYSSIHKNNLYTKEHNVIFMNYVNELLNQNPLKFETPLKDVNIIDKESNATYGLNKFIEIVLQGIESTNYSFIINKSFIEDLIKLLYKNGAKWVKQFDTNLIDIKHIELIPKIIQLFGEFELRPNINHILKTSFSVDVTHNISQKDQIENKILKHILQNTYINISITSILPKSLLELIAEYTIEPSYKLIKWIPVKKLQIDSLINNSRAFEIIINKFKIQNFLSYEKLQTSELITPELIKKLKKLSKNHSYKAVKILSLFDLSKIKSTKFWEDLSQNPYAIDLLIKNKHMINYTYLALNTSYLVVDLIVDYIVDHIAHFSTQISINLTKNIHIGEIYQKLQINDLIKNNRVGILFDSYIKNSIDNFIYKIINNQLLNRSIIEFKEQHQLFQYIPQIPLLQPHQQHQPLLQLQPHQLLQLHQHQHQQNRFSHPYGNCIIKISSINDKIAMPDKIPMSDIYEVVYLNYKPTDIDFAYSITSIDYKISMSDKSSDAIRFIVDYIKYMFINKKTFVYDQKFHLSQNPNINIIYKKLLDQNINILEVIDWSELSKNNEAIEILLNDYNTNNGKNINYDNICGNEKAIEILTKEYEKNAIVNWFKLTQNPNAISILLKECDKDFVNNRIEWDYLPYNENTLLLLKREYNKNNKNVPINFYRLSACLDIFEIDKTKTSEEACKFIEFFT